MEQKISTLLQESVKKLFDLDLSVTLSVPDEQFGDYATNVALQLSGRLQRPAVELAREIVTELGQAGIHADVAGPGFINMWMHDEGLWELALQRKVDLNQGRIFVAEYSCPNYFKELHAGHLYQTLYGDALARIIEASGATVHRTNFGADVGLSAARAIWGILQYLEGEHPHKLDDVPESDRTSFIAARYVEGAAADTSDNDTAVTEIQEINKRIYAMHASNDTESDFAKIYYTTREWCRQYFIDLYEALHVDAFEKFYPESSTEGRGVQVVRDHIGEVFTESQGAVIYDGEKDGLHTRVFITKEGLPTYETKDLGLILIEMEEFEFDHRVLITGKEQAEYMKVVWQATDKIVPGIAEKMTHLTNGLIRFGDGQKMSSRFGNVTTAMDVIHAVRTAVGDSGDTIRDTQIYLGALKYELLKYRLGGDIAFDPQQSVSLHGNSGPYLQYAAVRAKAILVKVTASEENFTLEPAERKVVRKLSEYRSVLERATKEMMLHHICTYLYELAQEFNRFYEGNHVAGDPREGVRSRIGREYLETLVHGLGLLGIEVPDKM